MLKTIQCFKTRVLPVTCIPLFSACITNTSFKCNYQCCCYFSINNGLFRYNSSISNNTHVIQYSILLGENGSKCNMPKRSRSKSKKHSSTKTTPKKKSKVKQSKILNKNYSSKLLQLENYDGQLTGEACSNNSDELCVVYDFKEEKKNRVYEVITLSGDSDIDDSDEIVFLGCFKSEPAKTVEEVFLSSDSEHEISSDVGNFITKFERGSMKTELQPNDVDSEVSSQMLEDNYEKETQELNTVPYRIRIDPETITSLLHPINNIENDFASGTLCCDEVKTTSLVNIYSHAVENRNTINKETEISDGENCVVDVDNIVQPKKLKELCYRALTDFVEDNEKEEKLKDLNFRAACTAHTTEDKENQKNSNSQCEYQSTNVDVLEQHNSWQEVPENGKHNYSSLSNSCSMKEETDFCEISQTLNVSTGAGALIRSIETEVKHENSELLLQPGRELEDSNSIGGPVLLNTEETFIEGNIQSEQETCFSYSNGELEIIDVVDHSVECVSDECNSENISSSEFDDDSCDYEEFTGKHKSKAEWRDTKIKIECRNEEFTDYGKIMRTVDFVGKFKVFKVMSYNVLSQHLLYEHLHLYSKHDQDALDWKRRRRLIFNEITAEQPDILCLQEVEEEHIPTFYNRLNEIGYKNVYKQRTGNHVDGCAIYFKPSVFKLEEVSAVEFKQPGVRVLDRDNVGIVLKFRVTDSPSNCLVVATTHLLYNPRRQDVKLAQVQVLLAEIERLAYNNKTNLYYPVILTGDFNLTPGTGVYKLITKGHLKYEGMSYKTLTPSEDYTSMTKQLLPCRLGITDSCQHVDILDKRTKTGGRGRVKLFHTEKKRSRRYLNENDSHCENDGRFYTGELSHNLNFSSVYQHETLDGRKEATTYHTDWVTVDYIFYSQVRNTNNELIEGDLQLISKLRLPSQEECQNKIKYLPNFTFGSDHLALVAKFALNLH